MKEVTKNEIYKHYIGLDWSKVNFALASIRDNGIKHKVEEHPADLKIFFALVDVPERSEGH